MPGLLNQEEIRHPLKAYADHDSDVGNARSTEAQGTEAANNTPVPDSPIATENLSDKQDAWRMATRGGVYKPLPPKSKAEIGRVASVWQAAAAQGAKADEQDRARRMVFLEQEMMKEMRRQHFHRPHEKDHAGNPIRFYGPGPDGRVNWHDPPIGTLHVARWRYELAAIDDPDGAPYYHEHPCLKDDNGLHIRPSYVVKSHEASREVNYYRWQRVPAGSLNGLKVFPGAGATRADHDEYLLNESDFNYCHGQERAFRLSLDNRERQRICTIYPKGSKLLKHLSKMNGYAEWTEGQCLGSDPKNPNGITKHLGWIPTRLRNPKAGLGADPQDEIWKDIFQGNLHVKPTKTFVRPKDTWKEDPSRVMTMVSSKDASNTMDVVSLPALLNMLPPPEPDTIDNRNASLASRQAKPIIVKDETKVVADTKKIERKVHVEVLTLSDSSVTDQGVETGESEEIDAVTTGVNSLDLLKDKDNGKDVKEEYKGKNDRREEDTKANGRSHVPAGYVSFRARFLGIAVAKS